MGVDRVVRSGALALARGRLPKGETAEAILERFVYVYSDRDRAGARLSDIDPEVQEVLMFEVWRDACRALGLRQRFLSASAVATCQDDPCEEAIVEETGDQAAGADRATADREGEGES